MISQPGREAEKESLLIRVTELNQYLMQRIERLEVIEAEYAERLKIGTQIAKQMLKEIREGDIFTKYAFMKILEKTQKTQKANKKDVVKVVQNKDNLGRMTVCNVPARTPKLLINKKAPKVVAKQKAPKQLTPQGLDDEPQLLHADV